MATILGIPYLLVGKQVAEEGNYKVITSTF